MAENTKSSLSAAEEQLAHAKAKLDEMIAARDRAKAALEEIEQKRRSFARDFLLGAMRDAKSTRAAANERNDAQTALEDMELLVDEAQSAVQRAQGLIISRRFGDHWEDILTLGARHADLLEKVITTRDTLYAATTEYAVIGQQILAAASRARTLFPHGAMGGNPSRVIEYVTADAQKLASIIGETMPNDIFSALPKRFGFGASCADALEKERAFWKQQNLDDPNAASQAEIAA